MHLWTEDEHGREKKWNQIMQDNHMRRTQETKLSGVVVGSFVTMELYSTNNKVVYFIPPLPESYSVSTPQRVK